MTPPDAVTQAERSPVAPRPADEKPARAGTGQQAADAPEARQEGGWRELRALWGTALLIVGFDQLSKAWVRATIPQGSEKPLLPGWVHLSHIYNSGAAWGVLSGRRWLLVGVAVAVIALVANVARDIARRGPLAACGLGLIVGGAIGNLIDRVAQGSVTDFIDLDTPITWLRTFPVWNVADAALTVGAVLMILAFLTTKAGEKEAGR